MEPERRLRSLSQEPAAPGVPPAAKQMPAQPARAPAAPKIAFAFSEPGEGRSRPRGNRRRQPSPRPARSFEARIRIFGWLLFAPGFMLSAVLLWKIGAAWSVIASTLGLLALVTFILLGALLEQILRPLQTLSNVVASLRERDYSFRARGSRRGDALGELAIEVNQLADQLQEGRVAEVEAAALLRNVVEFMDAPVIAYDRDGLLRLLNPAAGRLLNLAAVEALGKPVSSLGLHDVVEQPDREILTFAKNGGGSRWMVHRSSFRQRGLPLTLLILTDVGAALREQEREAWRRLIRVMGHEINNSLTPIKAIAGALKSRMLASDAAGIPDFERALNIIESRAESLNRFLQAYRQLSELPKPALRRTQLRPLLERVAAIETRLRVHLDPGLDLTLMVDPDQMEQMMINLIRNAVEAALARSPEPGSSLSPDPAVSLSWRRDGEFVEILVTDNGAGVMNPSSLFVPFYTTKAGGSGVGLALARQICEGLGGSLSLVNLPLGHGCQAQLRIPIDPGVESARR
jgi:nitrogen fixation/metabolism regulation signal transduction histidine kinase